jgi:hypothetical protein
MKGFLHIEEEEGDTLSVDTEGDGEGSWLLIDLTSSTTCNQDETEISLMIPVSHISSFPPLTLP